MQPKINKIQLIIGSMQPGFIIQFWQEVRKMKFNEKLQSLRKEKGFSQEQLADLLEVSRQSVSKWESGQTYPEMDKLLSLCKIFNITLDELTNDEIDINTINNNSSNVGYSILEELKYLIDETINLFLSMNFKTFIKLLGLFIIMLFTLLILSIPFNYLVDIGNNTFYQINPVVGIIFGGLWSFMIKLIFFGLATYSVYYVYKHKVLTSEEFPKKENIRKEEDTNGEVIVNKNISQTNSNISNLFSKALIVIIKVIALFIIFSLLVSLVTLTVLFGLGIGLIFMGIFYVGIYVALLAAVTINLLLLYLLISFVFNNKVNYNIIVKLFLVSVIVGALSMSISFFEFSKTKIINDAPTHESLTINEKELTMTNDIILIDSYYNNEIEYVINNELDDKFIVKQSYFEDFITPNLVVNNNIVYLNKTTNNNFLPNIIEVVLDSLKEKTLYNFEEVSFVKTIIETSEENINIIKNNTKTHFENIEEDEYNDRLDYYEERLDYYQDTVDDLETKLDEEINKNQELNAKIQEYKDQLSNIFE